MQKNNALIECFDLILQFEKFSLLLFGNKYFTKKA
jgi:hypothetical protein